MADPKAIVFSLGYVESWIEKVIQFRPEIINGEVALQHLKIVEDATVEYRRTLSLFKQQIAAIKEKVDVANVL